MGNGPLFMGTIHPVLTRDTAIALKDGALVNARSAARGTHPRT
jgi:hypothetical protein